MRSDRTVTTILSDFFDKQTDTDPRISTDCEGLAAGSLYTSVLQKHRSLASIIVAISTPQKLIACGNAFKKIQADRQGRKRRDRCTALDDVVPARADSAMQTAIRDAAKSLDLHY